MMNWKKWGFVGAATMFVFSVFFGNNASSYLTTSMNWAGESLAVEVPLEFELDRLRELTKKVEPEVQKNMQAVAQEEVKVNLLNAKIVKLQEQLNSQEMAVVRLRDDLATGRSRFVYSGYSYSADQVKTDLSSRFERYKTNKLTLDNLTQIRDARLGQLEAAKMKIEEMRNIKHQLMAKVEQLEAQRKLNEVARTSNEFNFDSSAMGLAKELAQSLEARLEVERKQLIAESFQDSQIQLDESSVSKDVLEQVTDFFGVKTEEVALSK